MVNLPYKRKQYLVDRGYQLRFVSRLFLVVLAVAVTSCLVSSGMVWRHLYKTHAWVIIALMAIASTLLIELLLAIPLILILGIQQTQRLVGPMNRIRRALEAIGNGDFSQRIRLRQGDALEDLAKAINAMADRLEARASKHDG